MRTTPVKQTGNAHAHRASPRTLQVITDQASTSLALVSLSLSRPSHGLSARWGPPSVILAHLLQAASHNFHSLVHIRAVPLGRDACGRGKPRTLLLTQLQLQRHSQPQPGAPLGSHSLTHPCSTQLPAQACARVATALPHPSAPPLHAPWAAFSAESQGRPSQGTLQSSTPDGQPLAPGPLADACMHAPSAKRQRLPHIHICPQGGPLLG